MGTFGRMPNCGILGGHVTAVTTFLGRMRHWYATIPQEDRFLMCDMLVYMRVVMEDYQDRSVSGYPLHAKFKNGDKHEFAAIYHKHDIPKEEPKEELPAASSMSLLQVDRTTNSWMELRTRLVAWVRMFAGEAVV